MAKKGGLLSTILKIVLGLVAFVLIVCVGGYCYLKYALGIDIIDITKKLNLISQTPAESQIVTNSFEKQEGEAVLTTMFGENDIVTKNGDKYVFNLEAFVQFDLQSDIKLSDKQVASLYSLFLEGVDPAIIGIDKDILDSVSLKQITFSNLVVTSDATSVDVNYILCTDLTNIKAQATSKNAIMGFVVNKFVPDTLYINSTFNIQLPKDDYQSYTKTNISFVINNLNQQQTNDVLDILSFVSNEDLKESLPDKLNGMFCDALFGGNGNRGLMGNIKGVAGIEFLEDVDSIKIFIKKV